MIEKHQKLMVAIYGSPFSLRMIQWAKSYCDLKGGSWFGTYVDTGKPMSASERTLLERNIDYVRKLGAEALTTKDPDPVKGLLRMAKQNNATGIVIGDRPYSRRLFPVTKSLAQRLIEETSDISVHILRTPGDWEQKAKAIPKKSFSFPIGNFLSGAFLVFTLTILGLLFMPPSTYHAVGSIFLLAVCVSALYFKISAVIFTAILTGLCWNFFFIPPRFTWTIGSADDWFMYIATWVVSILIGVLTGKRNEGYEALQQEESKVSDLYRLTKLLSQCTSIEETVKTSLEQVRNTFKCETAIFLESPQGQSLPVTWENKITLSESEEKIVSLAKNKGAPAGRFTNISPSADIYVLPLTGLEGNLGVMVIRLPKQKLPLDVRALIEHFSKEIGIAIEREHFHESYKRANILEERDRLYNTLLNSVSHELKTPLTAIEGSATALLDPAVAKSPAAVRSLAEEVSMGSARMQSLIKNLLDMSRVESGTIKIASEPIAVGDILGVTTRKLETELAGHPLEVHIEKELPLITGDFVLIEQVFRNVLENACKYTPQGCPVRIMATKSGSLAEIEIVDKGPGITAEPPERVFEKFFRSVSTSGGTGLGLTISKAIAELHGGTISVKNAPEGGASFTISLPLAVPAKDA